MEFTVYLMNLFTRLWKSLSNFWGKKHWIREERPCFIVYKTMLCNNFSLFLTKFKEVENLFKINFIKNSCFCNSSIISQGYMMRCFKKGNNCRKYNRNVTMLMNCVNYWLYYNLCQILNKSPGIINGLWEKTGSKDRFYGD